MRGIRLTAAKPMGCKMTVLGKYPAIIERVERVDTPVGQALRIAFTIRDGMYTDYHQSALFFDEPVVPMEWLEKLEGTEITLEVMRTKSHIFFVTRI